jgi:hypothetical protein
MDIEVESFKLVVKMKVSIDSAFRKDFRSQSVKFRHSAFGKEAGYGFGDYSWIFQCVWTRACHKVVNQKMLKWIFLIVHYLSN